MNPVPRYDNPAQGFSEEQFNTHSVCQYWRNVENPVPQKPNQDACFKPWILKRADGSIDTVVVAVFDGHGKYGHLASTAARDYLYEYCEFNKERFRDWSAEDWSQKMTTIFESMHENIRKIFLKKVQPKPSETPEGVLLDASGNFIKGGTTATVFVLKGNEDGSFSWVCANVGDSPASLICMPKDGNPGSVKQISADHSPLNVAEWQRMHSEQYRMRPKGPLNSVYEDPELPCHSPDGVLINYNNIDFKIKNLKKERSVYVRDSQTAADSTIGLAFTRVLGGFYSQACGITFVPSVASGDIPSGVDMRALLYTDGVGDCETQEWSIDRVLQITEQQYLLDRCEHSFKGCFNKANRTFGDTRDDMTMVVLSVSSQVLNPAAAEGSDPAPAAVAEPVFGFMEGAAAGGPALAPAAAVEDVGPDNASS